MTREELIKQIKTKKTFLCVGLDPDIEKIPAHLLKEELPFYSFNKAIIDACAQYCVAFKPNSAFYEAQGIKGYMSLEKTVSYLKANYPNHLVIDDAKRGDIGNTSAMYAKASFSVLNADAITVAPYMGSDSIKPFLAFENKWTIVLGLTSNEGSLNFQQVSVQGKDLYLKVIETCASWGTQNNMMFVVGATKPEMFAEIRKIVPSHFLLVPGVGAQGGDLDAVCKFGINEDIGLLINSSRGVIYASTSQDFGIKAGEEANKIAKQMTKYFM